MEYLPEPQDKRARMTSILVDLNNEGPLANDVMEQVILPDGTLVLIGSGPVPRN